MSKKKRENVVNGPEIPMGLGMALAKNIDAMNCFAAMPEERQRQVIEHTHTIRSKREMEQFAASLAEPDQAGMNGAIG